MKTAAAHLEKNDLNPKDKVLANKLPLPCENDFISFI